MVGSNGAGKTTLVENVIQSETNLVFVNADYILASRWPDGGGDHVYEAARLAGARREELISNGTSFVAETVFSHPSKIELINRAQAAGYLVHVHVVMIPVELAVLRVAERVTRGGHAVPEEKIRTRFERVWDHVAEAIRIADLVDVYDNSSWSEPLRRCARYAHGSLLMVEDWPLWAPFDQ